MSRLEPNRGPIRVLHLRDSPWVDGPGRTILESASRFDRHRVDYRVAVLVSPGATVHPMIVQAGSRGIPIYPIPDRGGFDTGVVEEIKSLVDRFSIDVIHASDLRTSVYCILAKRQRVHLALVRTTHGWIANTLRRRVMRAFDKVLLRLFDHVILVSHAMRELVPRWWLPDARVTVVHNALPLESYGGSQVDRSRPAPDPSGPVMLLNVGRLSPEKGQDLLLRAVACLAQEFPGLRLRFAGIGAMEPQLKALAAKLGLAERVEFLGYRHDMPELYAEADLVVQSSLTEGLPNVILEAAFLGVPVLATNVGGTREIIEHGKGGWLIESGSVDAIVAGVTRYLNDPSDCLRMTQVARRRVFDTFSFDARVKKMTALYEQIGCRSP